MSKRPFGHGPFQYMKQFKAVAADYAYYLSLSDEGQLYCLSERQVYAIMVQLTYVGWLTRWYNTEDITQTTVEYIQSDIMEALMSCVDVTVLVNQAELNLVRDTTNQQLQSQALRDILEERYDGDPTSINPDAPTTDFGSSGDRFDALCAGLMAFVYQFARFQSDSVRAGQIGGLAAVALVALLLIPGLNIFFIVGASIAVLLGLGTIGVTTEVAIAALTDTAALDAVVCCMRENLKDQSVSEANWLTALDGCAFDVGSHEQIVSDFLTACLADNYLTILNILGQAYVGVIDGEALPECPCAPPDPWVTIDFTISDQGWLPIGTYAAYSAGVGWGVGAAANNQLAMKSPSIIGDILELEVYLTDTLAAYGTQSTHIGNQAFNTFYYVGGATIDTFNSYSGTTIVDALSVNYDTSSAWSNGAKVWKIRYRL